MLKLTKKADYGLIALKHLAETQDVGTSSAKDMAEAYGIPQEALAKILQKLAKAKLLVSHAGTLGGYSLAKAPALISVFEVIRVIDGPLFITTCAADKECQVSKCGVKEPLARVSESISDVLQKLTIADMMDHRLDARPEAKAQAGKPVPQELVSLV
jgi:Rrf2 family protein